jgi:ubiquinone/menaquinone biosynthesis C-methylase UbiE
MEQLVTITRQQHASAVELEAINCEICHQSGRYLVAQRTDLFLGGTTRFTMYQCQGCGVLYQYPRPTPQTIDRLYPDDYPQYTHGIDTEHWLRRLDRRYGLHKRCKAILRHVKQGRLLDVGCATGDFLSEMQRQPGWSVVGIEPGSFAAHYTRSYVGIEVIQGILNTAPFTDQSFDAITMWDVLEHTYNPRMVIAEAARLLRPNGVLVINHPNIDSIDRHLFGHFWIGYELPRHMYLFPAYLLRRLMAEQGLYEVERRCFYGSHAATSTSLTFVCEAYCGKGHISQTINRIAFSKVARVLMVLYFKIIDQMQLGSNITVIFKKVI